MNSSPKNRLIVTLCLVLAPPLMPGAEARAQQAGGRPAARTRGSDWTYIARSDGKVTVHRRGVPIVSTEMTFWAEKWRWVDSKLSQARAAAAPDRLVGEVPGLQIRMIADRESPSPNVLRTDLLVRASRSIPEMIGGLLQWDVRLDSPALPKGLPAPELLPDNGGWTWRVGDGQAITVRLEGASRVEFNGGGKNAIRTWLVTDNLEAGARRIRVTLTLPEGARRVPPLVDRYDPHETGAWFRDALAPDASPVDLSFLNRDDRPAGRRGFVRADGDRLVFADGTTARFWGANLAAYTLFSTPRPQVPRQARRLAHLGFNLVRIHHHDSSWVSPNIFGWEARTTRRLEPKALDSLDWWIKCLEDEGIYVWLDLHVGRHLKPADGLTEGAGPVNGQQGEIKGFCYYNTQIQEFMKEFQDQYLSHRNRYTNLRYADDPAVIGALITNENDATHKGCFFVLPDHKMPFYNAAWTAGYKAFAERYGLPEGQVFQTWMPGPSKLYLAEVEHEFNRSMLSDVRQIGVRAPIATTSLWGEAGLFAIPPLCDGDLIDVHSYGQWEELGKNAHYEGNYLAWIAMGQVQGKPLSVSEWNVEYPNIDRFIAPLFTASVASLQGWDAPMMFAYAQVPLPGDGRPDKWSTFNDPALTALMPAAALLFRRGHVSPARKTYYFRPEPGAFFGRDISPKTSATIRTLAEQSRLTIGIPEVKELPWLKPTRPDRDAIVITDPDRDFIPDEQSFVRSDTGELTRDWEQGVQTIDTTRTQAVSGWVGGRALPTRDASFEVLTKKAVVALSSVDDRPLSESRFILVTAVARAEPGAGDPPRFLSEPVRGRVRLRTKVDRLEMMALGRDGRIVSRPPVSREGDSVTLDLPPRGGTHWYVLKAPGPSGS